MRLSGAWLAAPGLQEVLSLLTGAGHEALVVGGAVRNAALGLPVADVDIATSARPEQVIALAESARIKAVPTGIEHGTVTLVAQGQPYEVTTFRRDVATDGRHAQVALDATLAQDAARRDFTLNALYASADGAVIDPLGGLPDLLARRLRFVGEAEARIREDYLRILRFFRFHALYADPAEGFDAEALAACAALQDGLEGLSRERVGQEMRKLLAAPDPAPALATMAQSGILARVLPGADPRALAPLVALEAGEPPAFLRRLLALGGENPSAALRLSRTETRALQDRHAALGLPLAEAAFRLGAEAASDAALVTAASLPAPLPEGWRKTIARGAAARFPVAARDLIPALEGAALGARLAELETRWVASGFTLSRDDLLQG